MKQKSTHQCTTFQLRDCVDFDASQLLGAPFPVTLTGGVVEKLCSECGAHMGHILKKPSELIAMVAVLRACNGLKLSGSEVRFLRKSMNLKAKELADELTLDPSHLSRIENDRQCISDVYEKLLRAVVCLHHFDAAQELKVDIRRVFSMTIPAVTPVPKVFNLELHMEERKTSLRSIGTEHRVISNSVVSWKDDCDPKVAV